MPPTTTSSGLPNVCATVPATAGSMGITDYCCN
jgi:hypothetical protein